MSPHRNLAADNLHIFSLGALLCWVNAVLHQLFSDDCFGTRCTTRRERMLGNLRVLMALMRRRGQSEAAAGRPRTLPWGFTEGMVGPEGGAAGLQGAEANDVATFLAQPLLTELRPMLVGERWGQILACGAMLLRMMQVFQEHKAKVA